MFTQLDGAAEAKHWVLAVVLGLIALGMIAFGGYHVFFRKPEAQKPEEPQQIAEPASETEE